MLRFITVILAGFVTLQAYAQAPTTAPADQAYSQKLYAQVSPSLVAVQYTWESELGRREVAGAGIVVTESGIIMTSLSLVDLRIPDEQMKDFKILIPSEDSDVQEIDATFLGRDERADVAFVQAKDKRQWQPVKFVDHPVQVGEQVWSVGLLPKLAGYKPYIVEGQVAALLRGELPQVLVSGNLASVGSPVFDASGQAVGLVCAQTEQPILLNDPKTGLAAVSRPPVIYIASSALLESIASPPMGKALSLPWIGVMQMIGLKKEVTEYFGLGDQTAIQIGDTIPGAPAEHAGIKPGEIILKINGKAIPRGDEPEELPMIARRILMRMKPGEKVTLTLLDPRTRKTHDTVITLEERPKQANVAKRFFADDLGFTAREMVFIDWYSRKLEQSVKGVIVALIRPQSAAQTARLEMNDMIVELNGQAVTSFDEFVKQYEEFRKTHAREAVVMVVLREGRNQTIRIEPPQ